MRVATVLFSTAHPLRILANHRKKERIELAGQEPDGLLSVNGEDVGKEALQGFGVR